MIARLDDVMNFKLKDLMVNIEIPDTIKSKMRWSKNVLEERESPDQIIFGSMDWTYCVLLSLAIHLEHADLERDEDRRIPMFGVKKERMRLLFGEITSAENFEKVLPGPIGTHSIQKLLATYARRNGCSKDDVDARGRWKANKRMVDTYIDCVIPFPDAKVASTLSIGGPTKYKIKTGYDITDDFILNTVCPNIVLLLPRQIALVLGRALLWGIYNKEASEQIKNRIKNRVKSELIIPDGENQIQKVPLFVSGKDGHLAVSEIGVGGEGDVTNIGANNRNQMSFIMTQMRELRRQNDELKADLQTFKAGTASLLQNINVSLHKLVAL